MIKIGNRAIREILGFLLIYLLLAVVFEILNPGFWSTQIVLSMAVQLPELGLLTLAMFIPIVSGGLNLANTILANICGIVLAWFLVGYAGGEAPLIVVVFACLLALTIGFAFGAAMGTIVAYFGIHPIMVTLSMMIFLQGLGEFITRGGDISGLASNFQFLGYGTVIGVPIPLAVFVAASIICHLFMAKTPLGFTIYMIGSNIRASEFSGLATKRALIWIYAASGVLCAVAGIIMTARFNSVRVGHGESYLLISVLACFLGAVHPFGGFGRVSSVFLAVLILQLVSSGLNGLGANQHLSTALWGALLVLVMILRWALIRLSSSRL